MRKYFVYLFMIVVFVGCTKSSEQTKPEYKDLREAVYASGVLRAENQYQVFASASGILQKNLVTEGDVVKEGDFIIHINNDKTDFQLNDAYSRLTLAKENASGGSPVLSEMKQNIANAKLKMQNDSLDFQRYKKLYEQDALSKSEFEKRKLAYDLSVNNFEAAKQQYNSTKRRLETEYQNALNQYRISASSKNDYLVASKIDGKVYGLYKEEGEFVNVQEPIALLGDAKTFVLEMRIDELDINRVRVGQKVLFTLDIDQDKVYEAEVLKIYPLLDEKTQTFQVDALLKSAPDRLYPGLTAEANIVISERKNVLVIPKSYLQPGDSVLTESGQLLPVKTGISNMEYVEIVSGLDSAKVIVKQ